MLGTAMLRRAKTRVLLVHDEREELDLERGFLRRHELEIVEASRGADPVALVHRLRPAIAVIDVAAAGGFELCRTLRHDARARSTATLAICPPGQDSPELRGLADAVVERPLDAGRFLDAVGQFVRLRVRRFPRYPLNLRFRVTCDGAVLQAFSREMSACGVFLKTDFEPSIGATLALSFRVPGDLEEIECSGVVRSCCDHGSPRGRCRGIGIEFEDLETAAQSRLDRYLERSSRGTPIAYS